MQCIGITLKGDGCRLTAKKNSIYCYKHQYMNYEPSTTKIMYGGHHEDEDDEKEQQSEQHLKELESGRFRQLIMQHQAQRRPQEIKKKKKETYKISLRLGFVLKRHRKRTLTCHLSFLLKVFSYCCPQNDCAHCTYVSNANIM